MLKGMGDVKIVPLQIGYFLRWEKGKE